MKKSSDRRNIRQDDYNWSGLTNSRRHDKFSPVLRFNQDLNGTPAGQVPVSAFMHYRIYRGGYRASRSRYNEEDDDEKSRVLLFVRKAGPDLFHLRIFDLDSENSDDYLSQRYYYLDNEIEELVEDLCQAHSVESALKSLGPFQDHYVSGETLNMIFDRYRAIRATDKQVEILEPTGRQAQID